MANANYAKGYNVEREVFHYFANKGYRVIRSAGSHEADLYVEGIGLVEVKYRRFPLSPVLSVKDVCFETPSYKIYYLDDYINKTDRAVMQIKHNMKLGSLFTSNCDCVIFRFLRTKFYIAFKKE